MTNDTVTRLETVPTASVSDALDALGHPGSLHGIGPLASGIRVSGRAFTVRYEPVTDEPGTVGDFLDDVEPGSVIVIDNQGRTDCTVWGGIMTQIAAARGIGGTVINGTCRDTATSLEQNYPIWSTARFMRTGKDRVRLAEVQGEVVIDGVTIRPGDYITADSDGVVAVAASIVDEVLDVAERIEQVEADIVAAARDGSTLREARQRFSYHTLQRKQA
ncbi:4-carboxy-4-hydroxy-2-oxoadipate aldolase/oxaloacetate decarboxylase [Rhodococcus opacus PD630]|uniref:RraA family protein n=1 Tax=Rhodococcus TaxID=1827 RepID=UPI00029CB1F6|nr:MULTISPECIES: RraA family protein [Rhodococcus]KXF56773.1 diguanylate cyclase [Rhodococcus sp. SC4]RZK72293.1 MAG: RraA family protein [Rhodococcus sp. (in: high G+C Gram-positive bacteria)]AHK34814.1 Protein dlpA [Rhodococcus opacus PD630]EHI39306.1 4-carboxy-4-hydroxy-2-oxoadipate aldolase/oxaloacetate decarboxylase [Rhodococcus opacus PD630]KXX59247.1 diguanylate cyclase [Rhodococcus sp. LB1]